MKNLAIVGIIIVLILIPSKVAFMKEDHITNISEEIRKIAEDQLDYLNIDKWDEFANGLNKNGDYLSSNVSIREMIINIVSGNFQFNWNQVFQTIGATLFDEITLNLSFMVKIFAIAIITGILNNFKSNFSNASVGELAWMICYIMIVVLIIQA